MFGGAVGLKSKTLESQVLMTLVDVNTGIQEAVASGSARKKDIGVVGGGLLLGLGVGALGGSYASTDIGKITTLATLDAFRKLIEDYLTLNGFRVTACDGGRGGHHQVALLAARCTEIERGGEVGDVADQRIRLGVVDHVGRGAHPPRGDTVGQGWPLPRNWGPSSSRG